MATVDDNITEVETKLTNLNDDTNINDLAHIPESLDDEPVPAASLKEVVRGVTLDDHKRFFDRLVTDFINATQNLALNYPSHRANQCDCYVFFMRTFKYVSQSSFKRIMYLLRVYTRPNAKHASVAAAIFCFFVDERISELPELIRAREHLAMPERLSYWWRIIHKHITRDHARDRQREIKDRDIGESRDAQRQYQIIYEAWRRDFPLFFLQDGHINQNALKFPDYGEKFVCVKCHLVYQKKIAISCVKPKSQAYPPTHEFCRRCIRLEIKENQFPISVHSSGVGMKCPEPICTNPVLPKSFLSLAQYTARTYIRERILHALIKDMGHRTVESGNDSDTQENSDSDDDEYQLVVPDIGRVLLESEKSILQE